MKITITIEATNLEEAMIAGEEAMRRIGSDCASGFDDNESSRFTFEVDKSVVFGD